MIKLKQTRGSFLLAIVFAMSVLFSCAPSAGTVKIEFFQAENCYQKLQDNPARQKYRSHWLQCINQFLAVYEDDPAGKWASAGLYRAGALYYELSQHSYSEADKQEAVDIFRRVVKRFPRSAYSVKAQQQLRKILPAKKSNLRKSTPKKSKTKKISKKVTSQVRAKYLESESCYKKLRQSSQNKKQRSHWENCIKGFQAVYDQQPDGPWAAAGLYMAGKLSCELYKHSGKTNDRQQGANLFNKVVRDFPRSAYSSKAAAALLKISELEEPKTCSTASPSPRQALSQPADAYSPTEVVVVPDNPSGKKTMVQGIRYWSSPSYTRVVVEANQETSYTRNLLKENRAKGKPPRLYLDLKNSRLDKELSRKVLINDDLLKDVRAGQYTSDSVRVVIDIKSFESYNVFHLKNPFRIVIDVIGESSEQSAPIRAETEQQPQARAGATLAEQLSLKVTRIALDAGHGGRDGGAPGRCRGVHEKEVVLKLTQKLAERIRRDLGCEVLLTRDSDKFLTLEERTAIANTRNADLFISIHTNACTSSRAYGIETYFLNLATDEDAIRVAARENATSRKNISDLQKILNSLMQNAKINESSLLAGYVQSSLCGNLKKYYNKIKNKGVKQAPFYVLLGAQMPAILVETGFISNKMECGRLTNATYQNRLCDGIIKGLKEYIDRTKSASFVREQ